MKALVVVVAYGPQPEQLRACVAALEGEDVVVVDNRGDLPDADALGARVLRPGRNLGFGGAVNAAAETAGPEVEALVLVNDDAVVEPGFVAAITRPLDEDPDVGMVAGLLLAPGDGEPQVDGFGLALDRVLLGYNRGLGGPVAEAGRFALAGPSGGAAAYRLAAFRAVGGFDERLLAYGEDADLALRLRTAGWRAAATPEARGVHLGGATIGVGTPLQRRLGGFARGFLLRRWGILRSSAAPRALLVEGLVVAYGLVRHRSAVPLTARIDGWRAAGRGSRLLPEGVIDGRIALREALRWLSGART